MCTSQKELKDYYDAVKEFTWASLEITEREEEALTTDRVSFIVRMILSEWVEFSQPINDNNEDTLTCIKGLLGSYKKYASPVDKTNMLSEQKRLFLGLFHGLMKFDIEKCFDEVHRANMRKIWPDGKFHKRDDGKIIKPPNWVGPDENAAFGHIVHVDFIDNTELYEVEKHVLTACVGLCSLVDLDVIQLFDTIDYNKDYDFKPGRTSREIYIEQIDALVDIMYYALDTSARTGFVF